MKSMKRQKLEPGSLHIVYLFHHQLTFTSGLGNHKKNFILWKSCMNFLRTPFVTSDTVFVNVLPAMMKRIKIKLQFHFRRVT